MAIQKHTLDYAEFYITNVCNYSCTNCNRFNNLNLKGFQRWHEYRDKYKIFSDQLNIKEIGILGGEPFLNPDIYNWIEGLREYWPESTIKICTNGSRPNDQKLLTLLMENKGKIFIYYSCHDLTYYYKFHKSILEFLPECNYKIFWNIKKWNDIYPHIKGEDWPDEVMDITDIKNFEYLKNELSDINMDIESFQDHIFYYVDDIKYAMLQPAWYFNATAIKNNNGELYSEAISDPIKSHNACNMKTCHQFIEDKLSKCSLPYTLQTAINQGFVNINQKDYKLLADYKPLTTLAKPDEFENFINNLKNPIEQCKFCPEFLQGTGTKISIVNKKDSRKKNVIRFT